MLKPDDVWIYKDPSWVLMLLRGQWETDALAADLAAASILTKVVSMLDIGKGSVPEA